MGAVGRAVVSTGSDPPYTVVEYPVPEPQPGAVLIRISLANICGSDIHIFRGDFGGAQTEYGRQTRAPGKHHGHEATGRVAALGAGVATDSNGAPLAIGDRVIFGLFHTCGHCRACIVGKDWCCPHRRDHMAGLADTWPHFRGTFGDYHYLFPNHTIFKVPDALSDEMVAGVNCGLAQVVCGWDVAALGLGERVVIQGAGGLGLYAIAVARERGAAQIIVIDGVAERLELARAFGADATIDMRELPQPEQRIARVRELTDGWGADAGMEVAGHPAAVQEGVQMIGQGGRYVEIGNIAPGHTYQADPEVWVHGNITIIGNNNYGRRHLRDSLEMLLRTRDRYPYPRIIAQKFPVERINEAMAAQASGRVSRASIAP